MLGKGLTADDDFVNFDVLGFFKGGKGFEDTERRVQIDGEDRPAPAEERKS